MCACESSTTQDKHSNLYLSPEILDELLGRLQLCLKVLLLQPQLLQLGLVSGSHPTLSSTLQAGDESLLGLVERGESGQVLREAQAVHPSVL